MANAMIVEGLGAFIEPDTEHQANLLINADGTVTLLDADQPLLISWYVNDQERETIFARSPNLRRSPAR